MRPTLLAAALLGLTAAAAPAKAWELRCAEICVTAEPYRMGEREVHVLAFAIQLGSGRQALLLESEAWQLESGKELPVRGRIDQQPLASGVGAAVSAHRVLVPLAEGELERLAAGNRLDLMINGQGYGYPLKGTRAAINELRQAVVERSAKPAS